jgi:hypothetical protein
MKENGVALLIISDNTARSTSGVLFSVLALSAITVDREFDHQPVQTKYLVFVASPLSTQH